MGLARDIGRKAPFPPLRRRSADRTRRGSKRSPPQVPRVQETTDGRGTRVRAGLGNETRWAPGETGACAVSGWKLAARRAGVRSGREMAGALHAAWPPERLGAFASACAQPRPPAAWLAESA